MHGVKPGFFLPTLKMSEIILSRHTFFAGPEVKIVKASSFIFKGNEVL